MNINIFFVAIFSGLLMVLLLFKPLDQKTSKLNEIPLLELKNFKLTELDKTGLSNVLNASLGYKYKNRYILEKLSYIDSTDKHITNIQADRGIYKGDILSLSENVGYFREDGVSFETQIAKYNKKIKLISSPTSYVSYIRGSTATGSSLTYNNKSGIINSKDVTVNYKIKER